MADIFYQQDFQVYTGTGQAVVAAIQGDLATRQAARAYIKQMGVVQIGAGAYAAWVLWETQVITER